MVIGVQWSKTLGPIMWDFSYLSMIFTIHNSNITLQGLTPMSMSLVLSEDFGRAAKIDKRGIVLQLFEGFDSLNPSINCHPQIQAILHQFQVFFESPTSLSPIRTQDHHIEFK